MKKNIFCFTLCAMFFAPCVPAHAQQPGKIPRIGFLSTVSLSTIATRIDAFRQGLRELGYEEGKNIVIEWRAAEGKRDRQRALVNLKAAKAINLTIPPNVLARADKVIK